MSKALQYIHAVARKFLVQAGEGITSIGNRMQAESKASEIASIFQESGLPLSKLDDFIRSEKDVIKYLNIIEESKKTKVKQSIQPESLMQSSKSGDVLDLKGNRIKNTDNIMGGEEIKTTDSALYEDRGGNIIPAQFKDTTVSPERVAQGFSTQMKLNNAETNKLLAQDLIQGKSSEFNNLTMEAKSDIINKINIEIKKEPQKFYQGGQAVVGEDLSEIGHGSDALMARNMQIAPGGQATTSTGLNYLLGQDNDTVRVPYKDAGPVVLPKPKPTNDFKSLLKIYNTYKDSMPGVSEDTQKYLAQDFINKLNEKGLSQTQFQTLRMQNHYEESKADGGRIGFKGGGPARQGFKMGKRAFLKAMGAGFAGIASLKTGLLGFGKKEIAKSVVAPAAQAANEAAIPPYFLKLVKKIKSLGDDVTETSAVADRQKVTKYKDFELTEDVSTGRIEIQRVKVAEDMDYYGSPVTEETFMGYSPAEEIFQQTAKGKTKIIKTEPKYEEGTTYLRNDGPNTGNVLDETSGLSDDIFKEVGEEVPEIIRKTKADGGRIGYKLGKKVIQEGIPGLIKKVNKLFGKEVVTTADKLKLPQKTLDRDLFNAADKRINTSTTPESEKIVGDILEDTNINDLFDANGKLNKDAVLNAATKTPVQQEGKFTKAEYLIQRLENTIKESPDDKYINETFPGFIKELKNNPELAKNENVFKELGGDLPEGQQIVVYGDDTLDFFTQKSGPGNIDRLKKLMAKHNISREKALKIMKMEPNDQVMELKMLEVANRKLNATGGLASMLGE